MTRTQYWIINLVSLLVAALIGCEMIDVHQLDNVTTLLQRAQVPLVQAQQSAPQTQALVRRTILGATRDPALKDLLAKYGITLTENPSGSAAASASTASSSTPSSTP